MIGERPIVSPLSVTVTDALAATPPLTIVITTAVAEGWPATPVVLPPLMATTGVAVEAKKPDGYVSVMVPPVAIAPSAEVVKENVAAAAVLLATRSAGDIEKEVLVT